MNIVPLGKPEQASFLNEYLRDKFWNEFSRVCKIKDWGFHNIFDIRWEGELYQMRGWRPQSINGRVDVGPRPF